MHILIAPNAFKNSLAARAAASAIETGLYGSRLLCTTTCFPIGDGGDGTGPLLTNKLGGIFIDDTVQDPLGRKITASFGWIESSRTAVIEMAAASGLRLLSPDEYDPLHASSYGTGELIKAALKKNAAKILLCVGGSATVDAGCGILQALGVRFFDEENTILPPVPEQLTRLAKIDTAFIEAAAAQCEFIIFCDVNNPLLGENGAARVFGPQKGADENDIAILEKALTQFSSVVGEMNGKEIGSILHGGAAGGVAAGLNGILQAKLVQGIDHFLAMTGFDDALSDADLVITGEGSVDLQTLEGKAPFGVAVRAKEKKIPVFALAGRTLAETDSLLKQWFDRIININEGYTGGDYLEQTATRLTAAARRLGDELAG
jgi:glycerate kinase